MIFGIMPDEPYETRLRKSLEDLKAGRVIRFSSAEELLQALDLTAEGEREIDSGEGFDLEDVLREADQLLAED